MAFDIENSVQRGVDVNTSNTDTHIGANNFEVQLGDNAGATTFNVLDSDNVAVVSMNSDGYLSVGASLEVHNLNATNTPYIKLFDSTQETDIFVFNTNPNGVVTGTKGSLGLNYSDGYAYTNLNGATQWKRYALFEEIAVNETLQVVYNNSVPASIFTNSTNGDIAISGTQALAVSSAGGINLTSKFNQTASASSFTVALTNSTISLSNSGNPFVVKNTSGDLALSTVTGGTLSLSSAEQLLLYGANGLVVDGYGAGIVPAVSNSDALGSTTKGFKNLYVENVAQTAVVGLLDVGSASAPNTTSGAAAVGTNKLDFTTFGPAMTQNTVQAALESIDGYFATLESATYRKLQVLNLNGAVLNGNAVANNISETPSIDMPKNKVSKMLFTVPVPSDWDGHSNLDVTVLWSPSSTNAGNVLWDLEYKLLNLTNLVTTAATTVAYTQAASGTAQALQTTNGNLTIPAASVSTNNALVVVNVIRNGTGADTFTGTAQVHMVQLGYQAKSIVH